MALEIHEVKAHVVNGSDYRVASLACRTSPQSASNLADDPFPLDSLPFSRILDDQAGEDSFKSAKASQRVVYNTGLSTTSLIAPVGPGPSFQAAAYAGTADIKEQGKLHQEHGLIAAFCERLSPGVRVEWILQVVADVRGGGSAKPRMTYLKPAVAIEG